MSTKKILLLFSFILLSKEYSFSPESFYDQYTNNYLDDPKKAGHTEKIINPDGYITNYQSIINRRKIRFAINIDCYWNNEYKIFFTLFRFSRSIWRYIWTALFNNDLEKFSNYMIILFSIEDRKVRITVLKYVRKIITDYYCGQLLESLTKKVRSGDYESAFNSLLKDILEFIQFEEYNLVNIFTILISWTNNFIFAKKLFNMCKKKKKIYKKKLNI